MKKWLGIFCLGLLLAACGTKSPLSPSVVYDIEASYGVVQSSAVAYAKLPYCTATAQVACKKPVVVGKLAQYDKDARLALNALETYVRNPSNSTVSFTSLVNAATLAVSALTQYELSQGIK